MTMDIGEFVTPSLRLERRLGAGGMGTVWVAHHVGLHCDVVVKFITGEHARNADVVARFNREAASAAEVRSPHVVQMLDHGVASNGLPYIAMELLEGEDLAARLARHQRMAPAEVAGVVAQVCKALGRAHERGIVHRDVKPENIFLCETGEEEAFVKVLDFGIAKVTGPESMSGTATGAMLGTPYFMSPEQVLGSKSIDFRTDLWSLGVVAFFAMTGARPFDGETLGALSIDICHGEIPRPSQRNPRLSAAVDEWFLRACAREPTDRFPNARAMGDALVAAVGGRGAARVSSRSIVPVIEEDETVAAVPTAGSDVAAARALPVRTDVAVRTGSIGALASTTGPSSREAGPIAATTVAGVPRRNPAVPIAIGAAVLALAGAGVFVATRGGAGAPAATSPAAAAAEPKATKATSDETTPDLAPRAADPAPSATARAAEASAKATTTEVAKATRQAPTTTPTTAAATKPSASAAPSTTATATASAVKKPPTTAKPKATDEALE